MYYKDGLLLKVYMCILYLTLYMINGLAFSFTMVTQQCDYSFFPCIQSYKEITPNAPVPLMYNMLRCGLLLGSGRAIE